MDVDAFIRDAIERGSNEGLEALTPIQRNVFLISEAEVTCDQDGVDSLLARYGPKTMRLFAEAYLSIGATSIARAFSQVAASCARDETLLDRLNNMVTSREGYSYQSIANHVSGSTED